MKKISIVVSGVLLSTSVALALSTEKPGAPKNKAVCEAYYQMALEQVRLQIPHDKKAKDDNASDQQTSFQLQKFCTQFSAASDKKNVKGASQALLEACGKNEATFAQALEAGKDIESPNRAEATSCAHWVKNQINASMDFPESNVRKLKKELKACQTSRTGKTCDPTNVLDTVPGNPGNFPGFQSDECPGGVGCGGEGKVDEDPSGGSGGGGEGKVRVDEDPNGGSGGGGEATGAKRSNIPGRHPIRGPNQ